jgi:hypothetical protein
MENRNKLNYTVLEEIFPLEPVPDTNYGAMGPYNSNRIIPAYDKFVRPSAAQQYINSLRDQHPSEQIVNGMVLPRTTSFQQNVQQQMAPVMQYAQYTPNPPFVSGIPYMNNALANDKPVIMQPNGYISPAMPYYGYSQPPQQQSQPAEPTEKKVESFRHRCFSCGQTECKCNIRSSGLTCDEIMRHLNNCPLCARYFGTNNRIWVILIFMIVLMFCITLYLLQKKND